MSEATNRLASEAEEARARLSADLLELRRRTTPGQLLDQALDYARESGGAEFLRNLGGQVRDNPLPLVMLSTSMAWLMFGKQRANSGAGAQGTGWRLWSAVDNLSKSASNVASNASHAVSSGTGKAGERVGATARSIYETTRTHADDAATAVTEASNYIGKIFEEQPLVLAGLGLAIGAVIGSALPVTDIERQVTGGAAETLKESTGLAVATDTTETPAAMQPHASHRTESTSENR